MPSNFDLKDPFSTDSGYKVSLDVFEGPLDLLLYLIKKDEVNIYEISIERITNQYLSYLDVFKVLNVDIAGDFIVMAAHLLYIKSRTLLPKDQQVLEEETEEEDPRWDLIRQLLEYKKFKEVALHLRQQEELQAALFTRPNIPLPSTSTIEALLPSKITTLDLIKAFEEVLKRAPKEEAINHIYEDSFTVRDRMQYLLQIFKKGVTLSFDALFQEKSSRTELVVTFLALLELTRMRQLRLTQREELGPIWIEYVADPEASKESESPK